MNASVESFRMYFYHMLAKFLGYPAKLVSGASLVVKNPDDLEKKNTVYFIKWLNQGWVYCSTITNFFTDEKVANGDSCI